jgi:hypothetical protein
MKTQELLKEREQGRRVLQGRRLQGVVKWQLEVHESCSPVALVLLVVAPLEVL